MRHNAGHSTIELPTKCFTDHKMKTVGETMLTRNANLFQPIKIQKMVPILYAWITSSTWLLSVFQANTYENKCRWWNQKFYFSKFIKQLFLLLDLPVTGIQIPYFFVLFLLMSQFELRRGQAISSFFQIVTRNFKTKKFVVFCF